MWWRNEVAELISPDQHEYFDDVRRRLLDIPWAQRQRFATPSHATAIHPGEHVYVFVLMKAVPWNIPAHSWVTQDPPELRVVVLGVHHLVPVSGASIGVVGPN